MVQYLFQGWGMRGSGTDPRLMRVKDMLLDTGTEEIAHVEMLATCITLLLDNASPEGQEEAAKKNPAVEAALGGGINPQHLIVSGLTAMPADSNGNPWNGSYPTISDNIIADLYANAVAEMQGRLQVTRVYEMTTDSGVRDMLSFMIARDHMHQMQWLAAIEEFGTGKDVLPVPIDFPLNKEKQEYAYSFMSYAQNPQETTSGQGVWAKGPSIDGRGNFKFIAQPFAVGEQPLLQKEPDPTLHASPPPATPAC